MLELKSKEVYQLKLTGDDIQAISMGLAEVPFKLAAPVVQKMQEQLQEQANSNV